MARGKGRHVDFLLVDIEMVIAAPRDPLVFFAPGALKARGHAGRIGRRSEFIQCKDIKLVQERIGNVDLRVSVQKSSQKAALSCIS